PEGLKRLLLNVERLGAGHLAIGVGGDLVDAGLSLPQQFLAALLQRFTALVDRHRFLERYLAFFETLDDRLKLFDRALKAQSLDVNVRILCHHVVPKTK